MKRTFFALTMLIGCAAFQKAQADVSVDFFYNNLSGGSWIEVADYGYCWQPDVAVGNADWRPYADGYWAYTNVGWTWVSYEDFGWATYHYGRWARLADLGWVWVPGRDEDLEWGPAWVSWRTGDEYVGWAPLPPTGEPIYEGGAITGHVDVVFDIGPAYYNFVDIRYIGEPVLRERIFAPAQNVTYINQTINVTNITYRNKTVYNYGPDLNVINRRASRPIQRLTIQRETNIDYANAAKSGGLKTRVQGQSLVVAAPNHIAKSTRQIAPPTVKTRIAKANLDTGWSSLGDARAKEEFKAKLKAQDLSKGRRLDRAAEEAATTNAPATGTGAPTATQGDTNSQSNRVGGGKGRNRQNGLNPTVTSPPPGMTAPPNGDNANTAETSARERFRERGRKVDGSQAYPADADVTGPTQPRDLAREKAMRQGEGEFRPAGARLGQPPQNGMVPPNAVDGSTVQGQGRGEGKHRGQNAQEGQPQGHGHQGGKQGRAPEGSPIPSP